MIYILPVTFPINLAETIHKLSKIYHFRHRICSRIYKIFNIVNVEGNPICRALFASWGSPITYYGVSHFLTFPSETVKLILSIKFHPGNKKNSKKKKKYPKTYWGHTLFSPDTMKTFAFLYITISLDYFWWP